MNSPSAVLLGNHSAGNPGYPNIETDVALGRQLFAGLHRYGSGWAACVAPAHHADLFDTLMDASGSVPFIFSYEAHSVPELPFVFAPTLAQALAKLEARLAAGKVHNSYSYMPILVAAVEAEDCGEGKWPAIYRAKYADEFAA